MATGDRFHSIHRPWIRRRDGARARSLERADDLRGDLGSPQLVRADAEPVQCTGSLRVAHDPEVGGRRRHMGAVRHRPSCVHDLSPRQSTLACNRSIESTDALRGDLDPRQRRQQRGLAHLQDDRWRSDVDRDESRQHHRKLAQHVHGHAGVVRQHDRGVAHGSEHGHGRRRHLRTHDRWRCDMDARALRCACRRSRVAVRQLRIALDRQRRRNLADHGQRRLLRRAKPGIGDAAVL